MFGTLVRCVPAALGALTIVSAATFAAASPNDPLAAIRSANDPSAVIQAYAAGFQTYRSDPQFLEAFVRRMIDLDAPDQAYSQARLLAGLQPDNGYARAAIAYTEARQGHPGEAATDLLPAIAKLPHDAFVLTTTGQLLGWYDSIADRSKIDFATKEAYEGLRLKAQATPSYMEAYKAAVAAYEQLPANPAPTPAPPQVAEALPPASQPTEPATVVYVPPAYTPDQYVTNNNSYYGDYGSNYGYGYGNYWPWYSSWGWGGGWWPWWGSSVGFNRFDRDDFAGSGVVVAADGSRMAFGPNSTLLFNNGQPTSVVGARDSLSAAQVTDANRTALATNGVGQRNMLVGNGDRGANGSLLVGNGVRGSVIASNGVQRFAAGRSLGALVPSDHNKGFANSSMMAAGVTGGAHSFAAPTRTVRFSAGGNNGVARSAVTGGFAGATRFAAPSGGHTITNSSGFSSAPRFSTPSGGFRSAPSSSGGGFRSAPSSGFRSSGGSFSGGARSASFSGGGRSDGGHR